MLTMYYESTKYAISEIDSDSELSRLFVRRNLAGETLLDMAWTYGALAQVGKGFHMQNAAGVLGLGRRFVRRVQSRMTSDSEQPSSKCRRYGGALNRIR